jgi:platelet-activating factor acetylhydrolase
MAWFSKVNPVPAFPSYPGPYKVGSVDVEISASELEAPGPTLPGAAQPTVAFRIFYPCQPDSQQKGVKWIPSPQKEYIGAYARFLGANSGFSHVLAYVLHRELHSALTPSSLLPQVLYYVTIPVHHNADILEPPTTSKRWPTMIFSHGLGGSRNTYSHICGSIASHGMVVVAPDHRDGSSPISFVHTPTGKEPVKRVEYQKIAHQASKDVYERRDEQLRARLWELGMIHDALLKMDKKTGLSNVAEDHKQQSALAMFAQKLNVHEPGSIVFAGHSFGAATMVQFVKSTFYANDSSDPNYRPLFTPTRSSSIVQQITPASPVILLDLWSLPIQSPATAWLHKHRMPCYSSPNGGSNLLAILSEAFYKWSSNLEATKEIIAKPKTTKGAYTDQPGAHIFYPIASAHLSQSDFGVLFPWVTTKVLGAKEPERLLKLNVRAILQVLRNSNIEVAKTNIADLELEVDGAKAEQYHDEMILSNKEGSVRGWLSLSSEPDAQKSAKVSKGPAEAVVDGEMLS